MRVTFAFLLSSSLAVTGACGQSSPGAPAAMRHGPPPAGSSLVDPLALVPASSDVVMKIDIAALRNSPLFARYRDVIRDFIVPGFADCKYDPFDDIGTVTMGVPMSAELGVFVVRGLDRDRTLSCLRSSKIETETDAIFDGEFVALRNKSGNTNLMKFIDARTAVIQGSKGPTKETFAKALLVGAPLREDKAFLASEKTLKPGAVFSVVARPSSPQLAERFAQKFGAPARGFTTTVHFTDVVTGRITIEMADTSTVEAIIEKVRPQLAELEEFVERYDVRADGATLNIDVVITEAQIKAFVDMAKEVMGN